MIENNERKDLILSKLEFTRKQKYINNDEKYIDKINIINKFINNSDDITMDEYGIFLMQLEFTFRKKYIERVKKEGQVNTSNITKIDKMINILNDIICIDGTDNWFQLKISA